MTGEAPHSLPRPTQIQRPLGEQFDEQSLTRLLHRAATVAIVTERVDLHGRYVAHLFTSEVPTTILQCFHEGLHESARMLSARHAARKA